MRNKTSAKEKYRKYCEYENIPIYSQPWWLDAVCGTQNWDVCLVESANTLIASMPYFVKRIYGFKMLIQPPLTQNLGPWLRPSEAKYHKCLSQEKSLMQSLISQLPRYDLFRQNWHYRRQNWLPFYWEGFSQTTRYTYIIDDLSDLGKIFSSTQGNIRREIRKAKNRYGLTVRSDLPLENFFRLQELTFSRQNLQIPYTKNLMKSLILKAAKRKQCKWFVAVDQNGCQHAGVLIVWDEQSAYYLLGGGDPILRNSGATSLCMWEAIEFSHNKTKAFDFEGSMIESIERYFRSFGGRQRPYFEVSHIPTLICRILLSLVRLAKKYD